MFPEASQMIIALQAETPSNVRSPRLFAKALGSHFGLSLITRTSFVTASLLS